MLKRPPRTLRKQQRQMMLKASTQRLKRFGQPVLPVTTLTVKVRCPIKPTNTNLDSRYARNCEIENSCIRRWKFEILHFEIRFSNAGISNFQRLMQEFSISELETLPVLGAFKRLP